jgi:hypothetical protein
MSKERYGTANRCQHGSPDLKRWAMVKTLWVMVKTLWVRVSRHPPFDIVDCSPQLIIQIEPFSSAA